MPSEPEYIWVEEDKMPTSMRTLVLGKSSILAPPEIVAKYGPPPGGGQVSPRHRLPQNVAAAADAPPPSAAGRVAGASATSSATAKAVAASPRRASFSTWTPTAS